MFGYVLEDKEDKKFYYNLGPQTVFSNNLFESSLYFDLEDTNEFEFMCEYEFSSDEFLDCKDAVYREFSEDNFFNTQNINIFGNFQSICQKTENLDKALEENRDLQTFISKIEIVSKCFDGVGLESNEVKKSLDVVFVHGGLIDFDYSYGDNRYYPIVKSITDFEEVLISENPDGSNPIYKLTSSVLENEIYKFVGWI